MNKKSQLGIPDRMIKIAIIGILLPALIFTFIIFVYTYNTPYMPKDLDPLIMIERFVNTCFTYQDSDTLRYYPGMIDVQKFDSKQMKTCYYLEEDTIVKAYKLRLEYESKQKIVQTTNWKEGKDYTVVDKSVLVYDQGDMKHGSMRIAYQNP